MWSYAGEQPGRRSAEGAAEKRGQASDLRYVLAPKSDVLTLEARCMDSRCDWSFDKHGFAGQSITDACIDWETTVGVLDDLAAGVRARRGAH